jgi:4,5-epoxidase
MAATTVLIAGAGPTGLALACDLRRRGIDTLVIDKADGPSTTSRALGLQPRGREILERLGAIGDLPERAVKALATNVYCGGRRVARIDVASLFSGDEPPLIIGQAEIEAQMRARLAELGGKAIWDHELVAVRENAESIEATIRTAGVESRVHAEWLVGCDGAHSTVRKSMGVSFDGAPFPETFILADVRMNWDRDRDEAAMWLHRDGMLVVAPLPGNAWRIAAELPPGDPLADAGRHAMLASTRHNTVSESEALKRLGPIFRERVGDDVTHISDPTWISVFRFHRRLVSAYRKRRTLLAGDAAHIHSALGGQGMNTGIGDAFNLGWKLALVARGRATDALLDTYQDERRPVAATVVKETTRIWRIVLGKSPVAEFLRNWLLIPAMNLRWVQQRIMASGTQLQVSYRNGPLARSTMLAKLDSCVTGTVLPGDRAPNVACRVLPRGNPTTLGEQTSADWAFVTEGPITDEKRRCIETTHARLAAPVRVISAVSVDRSDSVESGTGSDIELNDVDGSIARLYHPGKDGLVLLRPDGHIGWRSVHSDVSDLSMWIDVLLGQP